MSLSKWLPCDFEQCHPLLWGGGILVDHWSTISSCNICDQRILSHSRVIKCVICDGVNHIKCISLKTEEQLYILNSKSTWYCSKCLSSNLPFNHYADEDEFLNAIYVKDHFELNWDSLSQKLFNPFDFNDSDNDIPLNDADPDLNFYNEIFGSFSAICNYYQEDSFNVMSQKNVAANYQCPLSLCHINIRSMNRNFQSFQQYLAVLNFEFAAIGVSETWLTERNHDLYSHTGYTFTERHRNDRSGGGVGLFLKDHIDYIVREDLLIFCDIMESLFVEIPGSEFKMEKNIILGIIYWPPGTDLNQFSDLFGNILEIVKKENKFCYLLGDYNINLLNFETHGPTSEFADLLYANSFIPLINRPTRVTQFSATLIDNILNNNFQDIHKSTPGILATEISDHFPMFYIDWNVCVNKNNVYIVSRCKNDRNRQNFTQSVVWWTFPQKESLTKVQ